MSMRGKDETIKAGTRVKIREDLDSNRHYSGLTISKSMVERKGTEVIIMNSRMTYAGTFYEVSGDSDYVWTAELFEKEITLKPGQSISIRTDLVPGANYGGLVFHDRPLNINGPSVTTISAVLLDATTGVVLYKLDDDPSGLWTQAMLSDTKRVTGSKNLLLRETYHLPLIGDTVIVVMYYSEPSDPRLIVSANAKDTNLSIVKLLVGSPDTDAVNSTIARVISRLYDNYNRKNILSGGRR